MVGAAQHKRARAAGGARRQGDGDGERAKGRKKRKQQQQQAQQRQTPKLAPKQPGDKRNNHRNHDSNNNDDNNDDNNNNGDEQEEKRPKRSYTPPPEAYVDDLTEEERRDALQEAEIEVREVLRQQHGQDFQVPYLKRGKQEEKEAYYDKMLKMIRERIEELQPKLGKRDLKRRLRKYARQLRIQELFEEEILKVFDPRKGKLRDAHGSHAFGGDQPVFPASEYSVDDFLPDEQTSEVGAGIRALLRSRSNLRPPREPQEQTDAGKRTAKSAGFVPVEKFVVASPSPSRSETTSSPALQQSSDTNSGISKIPWLANTDYRTAPARASLRLHNEILHFIRFIDQSPEEAAQRQAGIKTIRRVATELWPGAQVECFGSFANNLCIPMSDVDLVLFDAPDKAIFALSKELRAKGLVDEMEVISSARIPIIKLKLKDMPFQIDISFDIPGGIQTGRMIRRLVQEMPALRPTVMLVKFFLAQRDNNETFRGGIGSHLCLCMVVCTLQYARKKMLARKERSEDRVEDLEDLGTLLVEFLDLFGKRLNYSRVSISLRDGGSFLPKDDSFGGTRLSLENPEDATQDLGSGSFQIMRIRKSLAHAHRLLQARMVQVDDPRDPAETVLDALINTSDPVLQARCPSL